MARGTGIYALGSGKKIGEIGGSPWLEQGGLIFFVPDSPAPPLSHPQVLEVTIWNPKLALSAVQQMSYVIPSRPKCGLLSEEPADYANEISGPYLRARRADNCGLFVARVKWAQPSYTKPELLPPKSIARLHPLPDACGPPSAVNCKPYGKTADRRPQDRTKNSHGGTRRPALGLRAAPWA